MVQALDRDMGIVEKLQRERQTSRILREHVDVAERKMEQVHQVEVHLREIAELIEKLADKKLKVEIALNKKVAKMIGRGKDAKKIEKKKEKAYHKMQALSKNAYERIKTLIKELRELEPTVGLLQGLTRKMEQDLEFMDRYEEQQEKDLDILRKGSLRLRRQIRRKVNPI